MFEKNQYPLKKKHAARNLFLAGLFVVLLAAGAWWAWHGAREKDVPEPADQTSVEKTEIDTSDWLTYRNEEYGFEFKYPRGWHVRKLEAGYYPWVKENQAVRIVSGKTDLNYLFSFELAVQENLGFPTFKDWHRSKYPQNPNRPKILNEIKNETNISYELVSELSSSLYYIYLDKFVVSINSLDSHENNDLQNSLIKAISSTIKAIK